MSENSNDICVRRLDDSVQSKNVDRLKVAKDAFERVFKQCPTFYVNVPGRVNLIGEHVDYCGYPVLPMAIEQSILLAVAPSNSVDVHIANVNEKYKPFKCSMDSFEIKVPEKSIAPEWHSYFLCGVRGVVERLPESAQKRGFLVLVDGNIPPASGLSSSSALVSAATLATSYINGLSLNKEELSNISADCERYIGTIGGGMDQAIAFLATEGCAQFIEWNPLRATPIALPSNAFFVIANSLMRANKAATSDFNHRVIECRLACRIIAKELKQSWREFDRFASLQQALNCSLAEFEVFADQVLQKEIYTRNDVIRALEIDESELENDFLTANTRHILKFKLRQRALHVIQESIRVVEFRQAAVYSKSVSDLSKLMRESHRSLQEKYECSHVSLNKMVEISDQFGVGARLTGAGWGGCIVAICDSLEQSLLYIQELKDKYYSQLNECTDEEMNDAVFVTNPQSGAAVFVDEKRK